MSFLYGPIYFNESKAPWEELSRIGVGRVEPWICIRDKKDILDEGYNMGGISKALWQLTRFKELVFKVKLQELQFECPNST